MTKYSTQALKNKAFLLAVSQGLIEGHMLLSKFAHCAVLGPDWSTIRTDTDPGEPAATPLYIYPSTAETVTVSSDDVRDTNGGAGAQGVSVYGCGGEYNLQRQLSIPLSGQTPVALTAQYLRFYRGKIVNPTPVLNDQRQNLGNVYIGSGTVTDGVPANIYAHIGTEEGLGYNQTLMSQSFIPAGYTGFMVRAQAVVPQGKQVELTFAMREFGQVFNTTGHVLLFEQNYPREYPMYPPISEKTDIEIRGISSASGTEVSVEYDILLVKGGFENDGFATGRGWI